MRIKTDTFYVVAYIGGDYQNPTFVEDTSTGFINAWGCYEDAERYDVRRQANAFIRKHFPATKNQYRPMRVRIDMKLYN